MNVGSQANCLAPVIAFQPGGRPEDLVFRAHPRPWERIASATLTQRPRAGAS